MGKTKIEKAWFMLLLLTFTMWQCDVDDFKGETVGVCPVVVSTNPPDKSVNVVADKIITALFNEKMDSSTIDATTFLIKQGSELVAGTVTFSDTVATFTPADYLSSNTVYTGIITKGVRDMNGNALIENYIWTFKTGIIPVFITTFPIDGQAAYLNLILGNNSILKN
jgi:hypothetical protein